MFQIKKKNSTLPHISLEVHLYTNLKFSSSFARQLKRPPFLIRFTDAGSEQSSKSISQKNPQQPFNTCRYQLLRVSWGKNPGSFPVFLQNKVLSSKHTSFQKFFCLMCVLNLTTASNHSEKELQN